MADKVRLRKGTNVRDMQERLGLPYACVGALFRNGTYILLDEPTREEMFKGMIRPKPGSAEADVESGVLFFSHLSDNVPRGSYTLEKVKKCYRLKKVS